MAGFGIEMGTHLSQKTCRTERKDIDDDDSLFDVRLTDGPQLEERQTLVGVTQCDYS